MVFICCVICEKSGLYLVCNTDFLLYRPELSSLGLGGVVVEWVTGFPGNKVNLAQALAIAGAELYNMTL